MERDPGFNHPLLRCQGEVPSMPLKMIPKWSKSPGGPCSFGMFFSLLILEVEFLLILGLFSIIWTNFVIQNIGKNSIVRKKFSQGFWTWAFFGVFYIHIGFIYQKTGLGIFFSIRYPTTVLLLVNVRNIQLLSRKYTLTGQCS